MDTHGHIHPLELLSTTASVRGLLNSTMRFYALVIALPLLNGAAALLPRQEEDNSDNAATIVAKSFIVEYAPVCVESKPLLIQ